jgi:hypothetical protein
VVQATRGRWRVGESPEGGASLAVIWPAVRGPRETDNNELPSPLRGT